MRSMPHIVVTRHEKLEGEQSLEALGWRFTHHDFIFKTIIVPDQLSSLVSQPYVAITSKMGIRAFVKILKHHDLSISDYQVFCLTNATKELAIQMGLKVLGAAPDSLSLAVEILKNPEVKTITHIASNIRRYELSSVLQQAGVEVNELIAYNTELTPIQLEENPDGIIFYSPSAVESFLRKNKVSSITCFCLGPTTAHHARRKGFEKIRTSKKPTNRALTQLIIKHYDQSNDQE